MPHQLREQNSKAECKAKVDCITHSRRNTHDPWPRAILEPFTTKDTLQLFKSVFFTHLNRIFLRFPYLRELSKINKIKSSEKNGVNCNHAPPYANKAVSCTSKQHHAKSDIWLTNQIISGSRHQFRRYQSDWTVYDLVFIPVSQDFFISLVTYIMNTNYTYIISR